ncbi:tRNA lysidine(34) synthetase TilS [Changchengzhania lutea]|uniref:tRNA lysidine(34) synthetase TilS n=1 Tax=Changchengzhania lutea TaxID=2049305 RepID=UPI001FE247F2|nr:tRNA lysidine(34) synthetase TilS [Changchengzhania lutea]
MNTHFDFLNESRLLIAISGGLDSVVLAHLCHRLQLNFALAHCNFNLRGQESDADEGFVLELAEDLNVEVFIQNFDTENFASDEKLSIQMAARALRYYWFDELSTQLKFDYILTAHHADDNLETFLINLSRGTGLDGLTGIPEIKNNVVRPLLKFSREQIEDYAKKEHIKWREDSSNASTKYLRNRLRHDVVPVLKEINSEFLTNFEKTQGFLKDSKTIINDKMDEVSNKVINHMDEDTIAFSIAEIKKLTNPKPYLYELLKDFGFTKWHDVLNLIDAQSGKQLISKTWRLIKDREFLFLTAISSENHQEFSVSGIDETLQMPLGTLTVNKVDNISDKTSGAIFVDGDNLKFPLTIRTWKDGDVFYPVGMTGKKKLSKYFKDEKMSLLDKENTWLLCSQDAVVWVIGKRADSRFKATEHSKQILKIELQ